MYTYVSVSIGTIYIIWSVLCYMYVSLIAINIRFVIKIEYKRTCNSFNKD